MMKRALRHGRGSVVVELPAEGCRAILEAGLPPPIRELDAVVARSVENPVGGEPLSKILAARERVVVAVPDATRGEALEGYLGALLHAVERAGVGPERVTIVTATGAHRRHTDTEREALVGGEIAGCWTVVDHDADAGNVELEPLDGETPLWVDARAVEADCLILAGRISYHYCAGFGGGRKLIAPGLCGRATVTALHRRTLANIDPSGKWRGRTAEMHGNPFHEALAAVAGRVGPRFALNVAVDWLGQVVDVFAGDPAQSHTLACLQYDQIFRVPIDAPQPVVVASCGGRPFDVNLYQAHKSIDMAFRAVQPGGTIVLLAACEEGWGPDSFVKWLAIESLAEHRARLEDEFEVAGHTTYALKWKATQCRVVIVSESLLGLLETGDGPPWLGAGDVESPFRLEIAGDLDEALAKTGAKETTPYYLMPTAHFCLPEITR